MKAADREKQIREAEELLSDFRLRVVSPKGFTSGTILTKSWCRTRGRKTMRPRDKWRPTCGNTAQPKSTR